MNKNHSLDSSGTFFAVGTLNKNLSQMLENLLPALSLWDKKILSALSFSLIALAAASTPARAAENFSSKYNVSYTVNESGVTKVRQEVTITNLTSKYYVSKYSFTIGSDEIKKIQAWDPTGYLTPKIEKGDDETDITLNFRARVYGIGREMKFGISYEFPGLAAKNGLLWEINLLKISGLNKIESYKLNLTVPKKFGSKLYSYPQPKETSISGGRRIIIYTKSELIKGAPRLAFGEFQLYKLQLTYHLENPSLTLGYMEVALPPDIPNAQQIIVKNLDPKPVNVRVDGDGNYLARYNLGPRETKTVTWEGLAALFYNQRDFGKKKISDISQDLVNSYTGEAKYWEVNDPEIVSRVKTLVDPSLSAAQNARQIFDFVTNYLSYDYGKLESGELARLGAAEALKNKEMAVCMEYTDLLIALMRAAGIPARELNGYAHTADESHRPISLRLQNGDVLHAWPEIYLPDVGPVSPNSPTTSQGGWAMIDPTWSSTSGGDYFSVFDLSHVTFVIKGSSSEYPLPAGSYKDDQEGRNVKVSFSKEVSAVDETPQPSVEVEFPYLSVSPFATTAIIRVKNNSATSVFDTKADLTSDLLTIEGDKTVSLGTIPPGATVEAKVRLKPQDFTTKGKEKLIVEIVGTSFSGEKVQLVTEGKTTVNPLYLPLPPLHLFALVLAIIISTRIGRYLIKTLRAPHYW